MDETTKLLVVGGIGTCTTVGAYFFGQARGISKVKDKPEDYGLQVAVSRKSKDEK